MKTTKIIVISILISLFVSGCLGKTEAEPESEPVIEYHNNFSTPFDVIKTYQYAVYSRNRDMLISCISKERRDRKIEFHKDDPSLNKVSRNIIYFNLDKAKVKTYTIDGVGKASIAYIDDKNKGVEYLLYKDGDRWCIE